MKPISPNASPTPKMLREACRRLEYVVGAQNLYRGPHRFIYPRVIDGKLTVENLATNKRVPFRNDGSFRNTWGTKIVLRELPQEEPAPSLNDVVSSHLASSKLTAREVGGGPTFEWSGLASPELIEALQHNDVDVRTFKSDNAGHEDFGKECIAFTVFGVLPCQAQANAAPLPTLRTPDAFSEYQREFNLLAVQRGIPPIIKDFSVPEPLEWLREEFFDAGLHVSEAVEAAVANTTSGAETLAEFCEFHGTTVAQLIAHYGRAGEVRDLPAGLTR